MEILEQIRDGIDMEGRESTAPIDGQVRNAERIGALWACLLYTSSVEPPDLG